MDSDIRRLLPFGAFPIPPSAPSAASAPSASSSAPPSAPLSARDFFGANTHEVARRRAHVQSPRGSDDHEIARLRRKLGLLGNVLEETNREIALVRPSSPGNRQKEVIRDLLDVAMSRSPSADVSHRASPRHPQGSPGSAPAVEDSLQTMRQQLRRQSSRIAFLEQRLAGVAAAASPSAEPQVQESSADDLPTGATSPPAWPGRSFVLDDEDVHCAPSMLGLPSSSAARRCCEDVEPYETPCTADFGGGDIAAGEGRIQGSGGMGVTFCARSPSPLPLMPVAPAPLSARSSRTPLSRHAPPTRLAITPRLARSATMPTGGLEMPAGSPRQERMGTSVSSSSFRIPDDRCGASAAAVRRPSLEHVRQGAPSAASYPRSIAPPSRSAAQRAISSGVRTPSRSKQGMYMPSGSVSAASIGLSDRRVSATSASIGLSDRRVPATSFSSLVGASSVVSSSSSVSVGPSISRQASSLTLEQGPPHRRDRQTYHAPSTGFDAEPALRTRATVANVTLGGSISEVSLLVPAWESTTGTP